MDETFARQTEIGRGYGTLHIHPPLLAGALLITGLLLHLALGHHGAFPFLQLVGLLLVAAGTGLSCYAAALFAALATTKNPYGEPAALVTALPYSFTRNPMYVGLTTVLFGFAVFFGSPVMVLGPIIFAVVIDQIVIPQEERTMARVHGEQYEVYKNRVPRWLPLRRFIRSGSDGIG
jgi:protein-S-isoprenylcysteine O-methyltransferase Ste14